ncbi:PstS family phosphate ABC transporter substrate-binding protein [Salinigranum salinum]|uniref:PstS family phosphate ABC transporter substrate-binding protein n=1 Tax=Salinigranum salinum TaxID=1364937 RepID=UPI0012610CC8|nr:PstS family phosphate ABC transporter substrate-binding protein [Salinigranum salinum]
MTQKGGPVSRREFVIGAGAVGAAGLAGCTRQNTSGSSGDSGSSGGSSGSSGSSDGPSGGQLSGAIDIAGSSTVFPLATAFSELFKEEHPGVEFSLQSTGSGGGFQNFFCVGETDFNNASRPISPEEEQLCTDNDVEPVELQVATDALTVVVNNENDWAESLTVDQLREIWSAEDPPTTWADIDSDWPDEELELFGPTDASGTYDYFIEAVIGEEGPGHRQDYSPTEQDRTIIRGVEGSQYAMGYLGFAYYSQNADSVTAVAIDGGDGPVEPSLETAKSGAYTPLSRPLFTYPATSSLAEEQVAEFARFWMENTTNQEVVADEVGYVPLDDSQQQAQIDTLESAIEEAQSG